MSAHYILPENIVSVAKDANIHKWLKLFHLNARSLRAKQDDISALLHACKVKFNVVMFTETWYSEDSDHYILPGYSHFYMNRIGSRGGGVSIQTTFTGFEIVPDYSQITDNYEVLCIHHNKELFTVIYRPPSGCIAAFFRFLDGLFSYANDTDCLLVLGGDFNIDVSKNCGTAADFLAILEGNGFFNVTELPTRVTSSTSSLLDMFITNSSKDRIISGVLSCGISDHMPIFIFIDKHGASRGVQPNKATYRIVSPNTLQTFRDNIAEIDWTEILAIQNASLSYEAFLNRFKTSYFKSFPVGTYKQSKKIRKPWISRHIVKQIKRKNKLYHAFLKSREPSAWTKFKVFRNKLNKEMESAKKGYYYHIFDSSCLHRSDIVWKKLNEVINRKPRAARLEKIVADGEVITGTELADRFNNYFTGLGGRVDMHSTEILENISETENTIFLRPTDISEVTLVFQSLRNSRSKDADALEIRPVKYVLDLIAPVLTHIFNLALQTGTFPENMQLARVTVTYKGGDKNKMSNYRPISILPVFSKGLEKIINVRINSFTEKYNLISDCQYGFRASRSTESALLAQKEVILENIENKLMTLGIYIDFSKAFDSVNHELLLAKLQKYGIRGTPIELVRSYLSSRSQFVEVNEFKSRTHQITAGVPQGSILGPVLFLFYINDIVRIDTISRFIIYADDCTVLVKGKDLPEILPDASRICYQLRSWSQLNGLSLNESKTKCILFHPRGTALDKPKRITLGPYTIDIEKSIKTLGVIFSENMSWNDHINSICSKARKAAGVISRHRHFLPTNVKKLLYHALVQSHFNYCTLVWGNTTSHNLNKLVLIQKKAVRAIDNVPYLEHTKPIFKKHKLLRAYDIYNYKLLRSYKSASRGKLSTFLTEAALTITHTLYNYRYRSPWQVPFSRTGYGRQRIKSTLPIILNKLDREQIDILQLNEEGVLNLFFT